MILPIDLKRTKWENASACLKEQKEETHVPPSSEIGEVEEVVCHKLKLQKKIMFKKTL